MTETVFWQIISNIVQKYRTLAYTFCLQKALAEHIFLEFSCQNLKLKFKGDPLTGHLWKKDNHGKYEFENPDFGLLGLELIGQ